MFMKPILWLLYLICVTAYDYDEDIAVGGYHPDEPPTIILTPGTPGPIEISEGADLVSQCSVRESEPFTFKWIRRLPNGSVEELSSNHILTRYQVTHQDIEYPIYCVVTRQADGRSFEQLLNIRVDSSYRFTSTVDLQLTIRSLPAEDLSQGRVMRQCLFENAPELNKQFDFRWLDHNGRVVNNGDSLMLLLEDLADLGNYTCEATHRQTGSIYHARYQVMRASRSEGDESSSTSSSAYELGPFERRYMVSIRTLTSEATVGRPYEMACEVDPSPSSPVSYRWFHAGRQVGEGPRHTIPSLARQDIGLYVCRAEWMPPDVRSGPMAANSSMDITLGLTREMNIEMSPPPGSIMVTLPGETRELHCEFHQARGPQGVRWLFEGQPIEQHPTLNASGRVHRLDRLRVSIVILRGAEAAHTGAYECQVGDEIKQTYVIVRVENSLDINPPTERVDEGSAVEFHCQAHASEPNINREIRWFYQPFYGGSMVPLDTSSPSGFVRSDDPYAGRTSFITKSRVSKSDEGEYICRLRNNEVRSRLYVRRAVSYRVHVTPSIIRVRSYQPIEVECYVTEDGEKQAPIVPRHRIDRPVEGFIPSPIGGNRLRISHPRGLAPEYNGTRVECFTDSGSTASAVIVIEAACPQGYRRCRSGQCIPAGRFCDGHYDCDDRSDEDPIFCKACDPIAKVCETFQGRTPHKKNYMIHWECDGEDDCGNGFDESRCPDPRVARCSESMFVCGRSNRRIPLAYVCDKDNDCPYGEDEMNCATPIIQGSPVYRFPTRLGGTVSLVCRVNGIPTPRVIWRFNWGCLPDEGGRFQVSSTVENCESPMPTVVSTLTIRGVQNGDDGIYNCEALAGATRAMSSDFFVMLE